jgi:hypothetical protein
MTLAIFAPAFFALGIAVDFIVAAILKINIVVIDGAIFLALASPIAMHLSKFAVANVSWKRLRAIAIGAFFAGGIAGHLVLVGHPRIRVYSMALAGPMAPDSPITLRSPDWPQTLVVISAPLRAELARSGMTDGIPVDVRYVTDYGCIRAVSVETVAGIDVHFDKAANWVWKLDRNARTPESNGPGMEDQALLWCRYRPF